METVILILLTILSAVSLVVSILALAEAKRANRNGGNESTLRSVEAIRRDMLDDLRHAREENLHVTQSTVKSLGDVLIQGISRTSATEDKRLCELGDQLTLRQDTLQKTITDMMKRTDERLFTGMSKTEEKMEAMRATVEEKLASIQAGNEKKLDEMRSTVNEKLEKTLQERLGQSFKVVSERLEQVYKGLGEMRTLASGVGDLKKVLSNVKTRGVLGEVQLGAILEEILSPEQYAANVATKKGSSCVVEYAVKLPGINGQTVWLPIDAKFPADAYTQLTDAYDTGTPNEIETAANALERRIKIFAKEIRDKYIDTPNTTDFAVMFLPFEGLYAEVARRGLFETLQREYKITVAGPTTMAAFLNSLQMGFRTLAIQKRSGEVWGILGAVKTEFEKFGGVLASAQQKLTQANSELDKLVGVRTRQIQRKLDSVSAMPSDGLSMQNSHVLDK